MAYNASGWLETTTDPKGLLGKQYYDHAGRVIKSVENYVDGTVSDSDDKTVEYVYGPAGMTKLQAKLTGGGQQETEWVYGITSPIVSNEVVKEMRYPDASTGSSSSTEKDQYTYNQLGQLATSTDRNGNVHTFSYDVLGRQTTDAVTTLGSGVDGSVRRVEHEFDGLGNVYRITNYNASSGGSVVNQVQREFDGLGQLTREYQSVNGSVNPSTTPKVQYAYSFAPSGSTNHSRLTSITYPNGRVLDYNYASGLDANISRLSSISDGATSLEAYSYLGLGTVVTRAHAESGVDLTYVKFTGESDGDAGDKYTGLDRFGRIVDQRWTTSTPTAKDRFAYGHDRNSNRTYKENLVDSSWSELYAYDNLNQLTSFERGTLNGTKTGLTGTATRSQTWDFDALGNFDNQSTDGTGQSRGHNKQNEITSIAGLTTPAYDANGALITDEQNRDYTYDAWGRLMTVSDTSNALLATYEWDGLGRRIQETRGATTTDLYYSSSWQVLEERVSGTARLSYVWSPVYIDAMIARDRDSDANGSFDERLYAAHDANFNVTALINTSGTVVERFAYDPYGLANYFSNTWSARANSNYAWNYLHQGGRLDADSGWYSFRNRELVPTLGRWNRNDPIGFGGGDVNLYLPLELNPTCNLDPVGLQSDRDHLQVIPQAEFVVQWLMRIEKTREKNKAAPLTTEQSRRIIRRVKGGCIGITGLELGAEEDPTVGATCFASLNDALKHAAQMKAKGSCTGKNIYGGESSPIVFGIRFWVRDPETTYQPDKNGRIDMSKWDLTGKKGHIPFDFGLYVEEGKYFINASHRFLDNMGRPVEGAVAYHTAPDKFHESNSGSFNKTAYCVRCSSDALIVNARKE